MKITKNNTKNHSIYNMKYFEERDNLDLRLAETIKLFMQAHKLKTVLDVGCGTGLLVKFLNKNHFKATGCDTENEAIRTAKRINNVNVIKASATNLPFNKNTFDLITSVSVIEHLTPGDVISFIIQTKRILKPHGYVFFVTPNYATPIRLLQGKKWFGYSDPTHINFYTPKSLAQILKDYGFTDTRTRFKTKVNLPFDWDLPGFFRYLPKPIVNVLTYLLVSTPFSNVRNSFWIAAKKHE